MLVIAVVLMTSVGILCSTDKWKRKYKKAILYTLLGIARLKFASSIISQMVIANVYEKIIFKYIDIRKESNFPIVAPYLNVCERIDAVHEADVTVSGPVLIYIVIAGLTSLTTYGGTVNIMIASGLYLVQWNNLVKGVEDLSKDIQQTTSFNRLRPTPLNRYVRKHIEMTILQFIRTAIRTLLPIPNPAV